jgi:hypothetical protein
MDCPACGRALAPTQAGDVTVDVCEGGCGGIWFDNFELKKFDEPHEGEGECLLEVQRDAAVTVDHDQRRKCPKCGDAIMMRHFFCTRRQVEVDECPACGGLWLDYGELGRIRSQFDNEQQRQEAAEKYFGEVFGDKLAAMHAESEAGLRRSQKIARVFRFICPSYYIPGRQGWGAF